MEDIRMIFAALRKTYIVWQAHKWEREARKALRNGYYCRAEMALEKAAELNQLI